MPLVEELTAFANALEPVAAQWGLDGSAIDWRLVSSDRMYELAAYALPGSPAHWTHGRNYWDMKQEQSKGHGRLYEIVFSGRPATAYLLEGNTVAAQKLVMAHVIGHVDLNRSHELLGGARPDLMASFQRAQERSRAYTQQYGAQAVEDLLDRALTIQMQVAEEAPTRTSGVMEGDETYADLFKRRALVPRARPPRYALPSTDLLGFIARHSPVLEEWERDLCEVVRQEGLYFRRLSQVKILHEGYAAYANQHLLLEPDLPLTSGEQIESARLFASVAAPWPTGLNPYWFGWRLLEWLVQERGWSAAQAIWRTETDASVVRNYCTADALRWLEVYRYTWEDGVYDGAWEAKRAALESWEVLRDALANALAQGPPVIRVEAVLSSGLLMLKHDPDGTILQRNWARKTCEAISDLWGAPIVLQDGDEEPIKIGV